MKNIDFILKGLENLSEDNIEITDYIECPYCEPEECINENAIHNYEDPAFKANCRKCKLGWLKKEKEE